MSLFKIECPLGEFQPVPTLGPAGYVVESFNFSIIYLWRNKYSVSEEMNISKR